MEFRFFSIFLGIDIFGFVSNGLALVYILRSFDVKVHVFTLVFIDALFAVICFALSSVLDLLIITNAINTRLVLVDRDQLSIATGKPYANFSLHMPDSFATIFDCMHLTCVVHLH